VNLESTRSSSCSIWGSIIEARCCWAIVPLRVVGCERRRDRAGQALLR
jgi:hypothetical protein